ncbi:MAG: DUF4124 domain-containing protein [Rhodanobacter sp.]
MYRSLTVVALLLLAPMAFAQVYSWTDAGGTVHYSQTPPPQGTTYKQVKTTGANHTPAATPAPTAEVNAEVAQPAPIEPVADTPENRATLCASLEANLALLKGDAPVVTQQDGKTTALDDEQRQQKIAADEAQHQQFCQPA